MKVEVDSEWLLEIKKALHDARRYGAGDWESLEEQINCLVSPPVVYISRPTHLQGKDIAKEYEGFYEGW